MDGENTNAAESQEKNLILEDQANSDATESTEKLSKANVRRRIEDYFEEKRILDSIDYAIDRNYKSELDDIYQVDSIPINEPFFDQPE